MPVVLRGLGNAFLQAQPVIGTPDDIAVMENMIATTQPLRTASSIRSSPMISAGMKAPITAMGVRDDGSVTSGGGAQVMLPNGFLTDGSSVAPSTTSTYAQEPTVTPDLAAPDQVFPEQHPAAVGATGDGGSNWMLAGGIALVLLAGVGIAVAVSR